MHLVEIGAGAAPLTLYATGFGAPLLPYVTYRPRVPVESITNVLGLNVPTQISFIEWNAWAVAWGALVAGADSCFRIADLLKISNESDDPEEVWERSRKLIRLEDCDDQRFASSWLTLLAGAKNNCDLQEWKGKFSPQLRTLARRVRKYAEIEWPVVRVLRGDPLAMAPIGDVCFINATRFGYGTDLLQLVKKWDTTGAVVAAYGSQTIEELNWPCEEVTKKGYLVYNRKFSLSQ